MGAVTAENLHDSVTLLASVHRDIDDEVPLSELRFVTPEVLAFDRQALQLQGFQPRMPVWKPDLTGSLTNVMLKRRRTLPATQSADNFPPSRNIPQRRNGGDERPTQHLQIQLCHLDPKGSTSVRCSGTRTARPS
jgi:hypothetical protein